MRLNTIAVATRSDVEEQRWRSVLAGTDSSCQSFIAFLKGIMQRSALLSALFRPGRNMASSWTIALLVGYQLIKISVPFPFAIDRRWTVLEDDLWS